MATSDSVLLGSGQVATIEVDRWNPARTELVVAGTPQSSVNLSDPTDLAFEYVERMGHLIDLVAPEREPLTAVHFGAGALTLPRYIDWTRPGSRQQVIELEQPLVDLVRERLPWSKRASIRIRYGDARQVAERMPEGLIGSADVVVVDVFSGAQIPRQVACVEFYRLAARLLKPSGVLTINVADGIGLPFARTQVATLRAVLPRVAVMAETQVMKARRFGNLVLIGTTEGDLDRWLPKLLAAGPHPGQAVSGDDLDRLIGTAQVVTDETATGSPEPGRGVFLEH